MEVLPLDAPYGMDHIRLRCCCTERDRICGICDRCETLSPSIGALLPSELEEMLEMRNCAGVSTCLYVDFIGQMGV